MPNNLLNDPGGVTIVPPDPSFQNQRIFVPREAASSVEVLGVIGSPLRKPAAKKVSRPTAKVAKVAKAIKVPQPAPAPKPAAQLAKAAKATKPAKVAKPSAPAAAPVPPSSA